MIFQRILLLISHSSYIEVSRPPPFYHLAVWFVITSLTLCYILLEHSTKFLTICQENRSFSMFFIIQKLTFIAHPSRLYTWKISIVDWSAITKRWFFIVKFSSSLKSEVSPMTLIGCFSISIVEFSETMNSIVFPLTFVVASIQIYKPSNTISFVIDLKTLEFSLLVLLNNKCSFRIQLNTVKRFDNLCLFLLDDKILVYIRVNNSIWQLNFAKFTLRKSQTFIWSML